MNNNISMATPINNIPLKNNTNTQDDIEDPSVQDVLREFESEISLTKKQDIPQQPQQQQNIPIKQQQYQYPQQQNLLNNNPSYIDIPLLKKTLFIVIVPMIIFYPTLFSFIYTKLPSNISTLISSYEFYIKILLIFVILYILFYKKLL
jgi:hypothetical protein